MPKSILKIVLLLAFEQPFLFLGQIQYYLNIIINKYSILYNNTTVTIINTLHYNHTIILDLYDTGRMIEPGSGVVRERAGLSGGQSHLLLLPLSL